MDLRDSYARQVKLLMAALPHVAKESCFALKGGTAINLFVQDFPRLSVDIDLAYKSFADRDTDLAAINDALKRITASLNGRPGITAIRQENKADEKRIIVNTADAKIKIEVSPVWRGLLLPPAEMPVCERVEMEYGFTTMSVVSLADLYGGKICAALDRQHPRDLFDVLNMLEKPGLMREILCTVFFVMLARPSPPHCRVAGPKLGYRADHDAVCSGIFGDDSAGNVAGIAAVSNDFAAAGVEVTSYGSGSRVLAQF